MPFRRVVYFIVVLVIAALAIGCDATAVQAVGVPPPTPLRMASGQVVPGQYIVTLKPGLVEVVEAAHRLAEAHGGVVLQVYRHALRGFSVQLPAGAAVALASHPLVERVEEDRLVVAVAVDAPTGVARVFAPANSSIGMDGVDDRRVDVDVAILDTGIDLDHPDLNVVSGVDCRGESRGNTSCVTGGDDDNGHGTHVAGTVAALDDGVGVVGVAPGARLWAVKVLRGDGAGYMSWIIAGIDFITANAGSIEVANISLGCFCSSGSLQDAVSRLVESGVVVVVAAGNDAMDASAFAPANHPDVITVSALADYDGLPGGAAPATCVEDRDDTLASFSNRGSAVEVAAPGVCIQSTFPGGLYATMSGTSMASPHVAGAAALLGSGANGPRSKVDVDRIIQTIVGSGGQDWVDDSRDSGQEPLLNVGNRLVFTPVFVTDLGSGQVNEPPNASFTFTCAGLQCSFDASASGDPDGVLAGYAWDFNNDGHSDATGRTAVHAFSAPGSHPVHLTVTDNEGATAGLLLSVTVEGGTSAPAVYRIVLRLEKRGSGWTARAELSASARSTLDGAFRLDGTLINEASGTTDGNGSLVLQSSRVRASRDGVFGFSLAGVEGVTFCSVAISEGIRTCM